MKSFLSFFRQFCFFDFASIFWFDSIIFRMKYWKKISNIGRKHSNMFFVKVLSILNIRDFRSKIRLFCEKIEKLFKSGKMTQSLNYPLFELNPSLLQIYTFCTRSFFAVRPFGTKNDVTSFHVPCCAQALAWIRCSWASALYHQLSTWLHIKNHKGKKSVRCFSVSKIDPLPTWQ